MKVVVHPSDKGGCGSYRLIFVSKALKKQGHDVRLDYDAVYKAIWQPSVFGDHIVGLAQAVDADVVVMQRPMHRHRVELISALQGQGVAVVVEIDDDFHAIHPKNPAFHATKPLDDKDHNRDWLKLATERADLVTVTTQALADRYGHHGRCAILPNYVPQSYLAYAREASGSRVTVGWSGSVDTHPGDLEQTGGGVANAVTALGAEFKVVGTGRGVGGALRLPEDPPGTGWVGLHRYPRELAVTMDVGIVPLLQSVFNEAKSWLKGLEYVSVGIPFVATPTGPYRQLHEQGAGLLAESPVEWAEQVGRLVTDAGYRAEARSAGLEVAQRLTVERNCYRWWEAWESAVENMRAAA